MSASTASPSAGSSRSGSQSAIIGFSSAGHFYNHLFEPMYFVVALVLPPVLGIPYEDVLTLIIAGKLLTGFLAPAAGWLGDRWSAIGMMTLYFFGFGLSAIGVGLASTPLEMTIALAFLGAFGAVYHPVGLAWMVLNSENRGKALGINGMLGGLGPAFAGVMAGALLEWGSWRLVFIIPGIAVVLTGVAFLWAYARGYLSNVKLKRPPSPVMSSADTVRVYIILTLAMLVTGVFYQVAQSSLPKIFEEDLGGLFGEGTSGVGMALMIAYGLGGFLQMWTGHLADRYSLKWVYATFILLQAPFIVLATETTGAGLFVVAVLMVCANIGAIPAENGLLAKYTPGKWQATAYGMKFIVSFSLSAAAIYAVAWVRETTGSFDALYLVLAALSVVIALVCLRLPRDTDHITAAKVPEPLPAE